MTQKAPEYYLTAYYDASRHGLGFDTTISGIVGRPADGAGTDLKTMRRDIGFSFKDEGSAKKALTRLKKQKIKAELSVR